MTLASEAMDWIDRSMPPSMMTKVTPVARMKRTAVSPASSSSVAGCRKTGCSDADERDEDDQRRERQPLAQAVGAEAGDAAPSPQTMCPMRSTCCGLRAGAGVGAVGDRAVAHDQDGVAEADRLLQRVGGQDHADALGGDGAHQLVDLLLGADVEAAGRVVEDQDARPWRSATSPAPPSAGCRPRG